ncbi:DUF2304 domain-containing protein [bacterium 1xD8-6]|jgi:Uncharacterized conserved protein (DUF2304).|nr:DUF2304 domain-containing protein [bacterium D16-36]RKI65838.1 DUF2304 domain-containing protein [bacterium 1xD8-6]
MTLALQLIIIALGIFLLIVIMNAAVHKKISESHALLWIVPCFLIIIGGIFPQVTYILSDMFHTEYPPAVVFALAIIISYLILFQCFKSLSVLAIKNKELASQAALLTERVRVLEQTVQKLQESCGQEEDGVGP